MKMGITIGGLVFVIVGLIAVPWTGMGTGTPGSNHGDIEDHPNWLGSWTHVMTENDNDEETWTVGNKLYEIYYSGGGGDGNGYNRYIAEMTVPWIGLQMNNDNYYRYEFSESTNVYHFKYVSNTTTQWSEEDPAFSSEVYYELDDDDDSAIEWTVYITIATQPGANGEELKIEVGFGTHPAWNTVSRVDIPFRIDPDVYDTSTNNLYCPTHITSETQQGIMVGGDPTVERSDPGNEHDIDIIANNQGYIGC